MNSLSLVIPSLIIMVALITDLHRRKIYNNWIVISAVLAIANSYYFYGFEGLKQGALAAMLGLVMTLPLVLARVLGAGDMKIMFAFGLTSTYQTVYTVMIFSLFWAAVIGVVLAIARGRGFALAKNTVKIISGQSRQDLKLQNIPYTVAIALAWITYIIVGVKQGALL